MYNIKYKGIYHDESQLKRGELAEGAKQYEEPNTISEVFIRDNLGDAYQGSVKNYKVYR